MMNDQPSLENSGNDAPLLPPPPRRTLFQELSLVAQQMPRWAYALVSLIAVFFLYQIVGGGITLLLFGLDLTSHDVTTIRLATMIGQVLFLLLPTLLLTKLRFPDVKSAFRLGTFQLQQIFAVIVAVFALQQLLQGYMLGQESIPVQFPPSVQEMLDEVKKMMEEMYRMLTVAHSLPEFLFVVLVIAVTPAVCEELLFRGLIQRTLESPTSDAGRRDGLRAAIIAGVIFGLYHLNPFTLIPLMALGVYFGFVVYKTQNIVPAMAAHFFNNFLACLAVYLNLDENFIALSPSETADSTTLLLNFALSAVVFLAATYYLLRITGHADPQSAEETPA